MIVEKFVCAEIHLSKAIDLHFSDEYLCALTLAGAAEEIFGNALLHSGGSPAIEWRKNLLVSIHKKISGNEISGKEAKGSLNHIRNNLKHMDASDPNNSKINIGCIINDSHEMISRCAENYAALNQYGYELDVDLCKRIGEFRSRATIS
ncbi:hypothetical protein [Microbulbifer sp. HZ11]|uniref:hypothetical protein n=1 Tax=Microbulbifer sp. HZ11 TaxID=1453501 RepID=UPI0012DC516A|nr:hypothetical protein [Microbulbifer sp. HZ11]